MGTYGITATGEGSGADYSVGLRIDLLSFGERPDRFVKSRDVGAYLGLVTEQVYAGESQPQFGISKAGDTNEVRKLCWWGGALAYIMGPFGPDTDLRRYGLRLCERGGKNAKKRAAVAVAR